MTTRRRHVLAAVLVILAGVAAVTAALAWRERSVSSQTSPAVSRAPSRPPVVTEASISDLPLRGVPLANSGLRLLVGDSPVPFILDVDRGTTEPLTGLPTNGDRGVTVAPLGRDVLVLSTRYCNRCLTQAYLVRHGSRSTTLLGEALEIVPSRDGRGVWMLRRSRSGGCTIAETSLDGRPRARERRTSCRSGLLVDLPAGLLTSFTGPLGMNARTVLVRPTGVVDTFGDPFAQPVVGNLVLTGADKRSPLVLHDMASGATRRLRWPSKRDYGLGEVTGQPNGTLAAVDFARYSPVHRFDLWLLDTTSGRWEHVPGMPAGVIPKATDVEWTRDGRVVVLTPTALAVWRPGERELAVRRVRPPKQPGIKFVVW